MILSKKIFSFLVAVVICNATLAQKNLVPFQHVEPAFWWVGMKNTEVQILFHNVNSSVSDYTVSVNYSGVDRKSVV